jgi:hypothetical protein
MYICTSRNFPLNTVKVFQVEEYNAKPSFDLFKEQWVVLFRSRFWACSGLIGSTQSSSQSGLGFELCDNQTYMTNLLVEPHPTSN